MFVIEASANWENQRFSWDAKLQALYNSAGRDGRSYFQDHGFLFVILRGKRFSKFSSFGFGVYPTVSLGSVLLGFLTCGGKPSYSGRAYF